MGAESRYAGRPSELDIIQDGQVVGGPSICWYAYQAGGEPPCCRWSWGEVQISTPEQAGQMLGSVRAATGVATACQPGKYGRVCYGVET